MSEESELLNLSEDTQEGKFLTFKINNEDYGISIRFITEIIGIQKITPLPDLDGCVKGVINLRGRVIPVIDVRIKFGLNELEYHDRTCIIVVNIQDKSVGLIIDEVAEVANIPASLIDPPPNINHGGSSRYIEGMGKLENQVVILLDVNKLLFEAELEQINQVG
ncbi:MAG: purine-binding chemotaxis protein CheW [Candidatus Cloacimonetes bacterium]|nr:purine-binding chemotaxis protein CheW [Candidatus Cloacimonadota bacterium]